jgi:DNA-binding protein Fis
MVIRRRQNVIRESDIWSYLRTGLLQKVRQRDEEVSIFSLQQLEKLAIEQVLGLCANNKSRASKILGISRESLYHKIHQCGISL